jgi:hypothetical protein
LAWTENPVLKVDSPKLSHWFTYGPSQISNDEESLSEPLKIADSEEQFDGSVNLGDSDSASDLEYFIKLIIVLKSRVY